jgi:hypothetical protein
MFLAVKVRILGSLKLPTTLTHLNVVREETKSGFVLVCLSQIDPLVPADSTQETHLAIDGNCCYSSVRHYSLLVIAANDAAVS